MFPVFGLLVRRKPVICDHIELHIWWDIAINGIALHHATGQISTANLNGTLQFQSCPNPSSMTCYGARQSATTDDETRNKRKCWTARLTDSLSTEIAVLGSKYFASTAAVTALLWSFLVVTVSPLGVVCLTFKVRFKLYSSLMIPVNQVRADNMKRQWNSGMKSYNNNEDR